MHGSIAHACKETGINRQQFNKYLSGTVLPGARTMRKICSYLHVSEEQLLSGQSPPPVRPASSVNVEIDWDASPPAFAEASAPAAARAVLQNGFYRGYFPVHGQPNLVARWLVHVTEGPGGRQLQTCRNTFSDGSALGYAANRIRYRGHVTYGPNEACLFGATRIPVALHGTIYVNLRPVDGEDYFSAMVLTHRPDGPLALSGVMQFLGPGCSARQALSGMGIASLHDPELDPVIVRTMRATPAAGPHWMRAVNERNLQTGSGGSGLAGELADRTLLV
jgi:transcriptional regulator with XRE-family HTH domain